LTGQGADQARIDHLAQRALELYGLGADAAVELVNVSENFTYRVTAPDGTQAALRVHRLGYHSANAIESELAWADALRDSGVVETPRSIPARDGRRVVTVATPELEEPRHVVLFEWLPGVPPVSDDVDSFRRLGELSARMHVHARAWRPPGWFTRFVWDYETMLGAAPRWGRWQDGLGMGTEELALLERLAGCLKQRLERYGKRPERYGLVHADLRLANILVDGDRSIVIDFDDAGTSWFMYDWGTAVSFIEHEAHVPELQAVWADGYRSVAPLTAADEAELPTFLMLRRLLLVAWIGSHHEYAPEAGELGAGFTVGTCELAERFLSGAA
jgi:Ser/Thr protein kinase RdoA (MazF antagonist)